MASVSKFSKLTANRSKKLPKVILNNEIRDTRHKGRHIELDFRQSLLASAAVGAMVLAGATAAPRTAEAQCAPTGAGSSITAFTCSDNDPDGFATTGGFTSLGGIEFPNSGGNTTSINTSTMNAGATIFNAIGSPGLSINLAGGADWTFTAPNANNTIQTENANGIEFGARADNTEVNITYDGTINTINGNAVSGTSRFLSNVDSTFNVTFGESAQVNSTGGTGDATLNIVFANIPTGIPNSGGGVVLVNGGDGAANWTVTNHGTFHTTNDAIHIFSLTGTGTHTINNDGTLGTEANVLGGAGAVIVAFDDAATATINNNNGDVWATGNGGLGDYGGLAAVAGGNARITSIGGNVHTVFDSGILAASTDGGTATVDSQRGTVTSTNGPGAVAISLENNAQVDAGAVNSGSDALSVAGFTLPAIPNVPILGSFSASGGVMALSFENGDAIANAHGNIVTTGTFGVLAYSKDGDATAHAFSGITVDPPIGMAAFTGGNGTAYVLNDGTVDTTQIGLLGVNLGDGEVLIRNTPTGVVDAADGGAGVLAVKAGPGSAAPLQPGNGDYSVVVENDATDAIFGTGGYINAPQGVGVGVIAGDLDFTNAPANVLINNHGAAYINGEGGSLLTAAVGVLADGNVDIINDGESTMTNEAGNSGFGQVVLAGGTITSRNDNRSSLTGTVDLVSLGGAVTFTNDNGSEWTSAGINAFVATDGDAVINNDHGSDIAMLAIGSISANLMFASNDVVINNDNGADFEMFNLLGIGINVMVGDNDVVINNDNGATFSMDSILGLGINVMAGDNDVAINNDHGATFNMRNLIGGTGNFMFAGNDASINNSNEATFNMFGFNGNLMVADNNSTINNNTGAEFNLLGVNLLGFVAGGDTTFNNTSTVNVGTLLDVAGFADFIGLDLFDNTDGLLNMRNGNSDYALVLNDLAYGNGVGDITRTSGDFDGGGASSLGIDAFLSAAGPASSSDQLWVGGDVTQTTALLVNNTNPGAGAYNPTGIRFAHVEGNAPEGSFYLPDGPIDAGFFDYDILRVETNSSDWLLVSGPNDRADELPALITGAQTLWYESAGVWLDRIADLRRLVTSGARIAPAAQAAANVGDQQVTPTADTPAPATYPGSGIWFRGYGGEYDRDGGVEYDQDLWGAEGGIDFVVSDGGDGHGAIIVGVLGGYVGSRMDFDSTGDKADFEGGTLGAYATYVNGAWYADLLVKANLLDIDYSTSFNDPDSDGETDALSLGVRLDTGYRFDMDGGFFVEPQATLAYVNTDFDDFSALETDIEFDDGDSLRGRLGLRAGMSWDSSSMIFEPFLTASIWHEFEGDNAVTLTNGGVVTVGDEPEDTYGEVGGGINMIEADGGMSFFAKVDALVGGDIESISGRIGGRFSW